MNFEFATAARIIFGRGKIREAGPLAAALFGPEAHILVVVGGDLPRAEPLFATLRDHGLKADTLRIVAEPSIALAEAGALQARETGCAGVIGFGGGSALDAGKAIAALAANPGPALDYLEVVGAGKALQYAPLPCIAVPTTAGTGAEVTRNAVLASPSHRVKVSLRHASMLPRIALVDPALTDTLPPDITASTGLDALTQCIEPYVCNAPNPLVDAVAWEGIRRAAGALRRVYQDGAETAARDDMALASLYGGLSLTNARLGAVHGFAAPIGGMFEAPHGAVCAALLPGVMAANIAALRVRAPQSEALARFGRIATLLTGQPDAHPEDGAVWVTDLVADLGIPPLRRYGITSADLPVLAEKAAAASSMKGNPLPLTPAELADILERAL